MDEYAKELVAEIIKRLAQRLGADGTKGELVVVFSGATVGMVDAMVQVRGLIYDGYRVLTAFSDNAKILLGNWVADQLLGQPFVRPITSSNWYSAFSEAKAVVVPLLSLNTAAKVSNLIADSLPANLMLHSLAGGKPLFAASNGAHPEEHHWARKTGAAPEFRQAALERLKILAGFGCRLSDVKNLRHEVNRVLSGPSSPPGTSVRSLSKVPEQPAIIIPVERVVTAAHVRQARDRGADLRLAPGTVVTPLAREMATSTGVKLMYSEP
jgi:hypothetical protein